MSNQDLIKQFNSETVPLLCAKWPERFYCESGQLFAYYPDRADLSVRCNSLDSLAAIAGVCGVVVWSDPVDCPPWDQWFSRWRKAGNVSYRMYTLGAFCTRVEAELAATIAAIAAVGGVE